jgi:hypothetical protein
MMPAMSKPAEIKAQILAAEKDYKKTGKSIDAQINLTTYYDLQRLPNRPSLMSKPAYEAIDLEDKTADPRWQAYFQKSKTNIGVYRSIGGCYWLLRYDPGFSAHWLDQVGTAQVVIDRFGVK